MYHNIGTDSQHPQIIVNAYREIVAFPFQDHFTVPKSSCFGHGALAQWTKPVSLNNSAVDAGKTVLYPFKSSFAFCRWWTTSKREPHEETQHLIQVTWTHITLVVHQCPIQWCQPQSTSHLRMLPKWLITPKAQHKWTQKEHDSEIWLSNYQTDPS